MIRKFATASALIAAAALPLLADFTYQEKTTVTGGAMASMMKVAGVFSKQAREPIEATVSVQGNKMVRRGPQRTSIIDLDAQTITEIDMQRKTYSVMTFEQMKQMMQQAAQKMHQQDPNQPQASFKVSADRTGNSKSIDGMDAKEIVLKMVMENTDPKSGQKGSMTITNDMWIAPAVHGYQEVKDFHKRMAEKINWAPGGNMFTARPDMMEGMAQVAKEMAKLDGMPVLQVFSMGGVGQGAAGGEGAAQQPPPQQQQDQQQQSKPSIGGALGGALGGHFGLGRKKSQDSSSGQGSSSQSSAGGGSAGGAPGSLIEMTTESSGFSSAPVDSSLFNIPAGFKQVQPDSRRMQ